MVTSSRKCHILKPENPNPKQRLEPALQRWCPDGKVAVPNLRPRVTSQYMAAYCSMGSHLNQLQLFSSSSSSSAIHSRAGKIFSLADATNQPSGRGLLPSPTAWSPDQHHVALLADVSRHILGRTEGCGLRFGQLVRTHTGKCLKCPSSSDGHSDHNALCAG